MSSLVYRQKPTVSGRLGKALNPTTVCTSRPTLTYASSFQTCGLERVHVDGDTSAEMMTGKERSFTWLSSSESPATQLPTESFTNGNEPGEKETHHLTPASQTLVCGARAHAASPVRPVGIPPDSPATPYNQHPTPAPREVDCFRLTSALRAARRMNVAT